MKTAPLKKRPVSSVVELQEAFETFYEELCAEFAKVQTNTRRLQQVRPGTEMYDQTWADLYVSLNVVETKAHALQEVLDQISAWLNDKS